MGYRIKEVFYSLQGEGMNTGRAAVFCRFSGCNLWSGHEADREAAVCRFCDTDFVGVEGEGGGVFETAAGLVEAIVGAWPSLELGVPLVVCTGGEPLLQLDAALIDALHRGGFEVAVETNGTVLAPDNIDHLCVSPKANARLRQRSGEELKLVYPQEGLDPKDYEGMGFRRLYLQPMDMPEGSQSMKHMQAALTYCLENPQWRLSLQTHKWLGIP